MFPFLSYLGYTENLPCVSQLSPEKPFKQVQEYEAPSTEHSPLFLQGLGKHGESAKIK